MTSRVRCWMTGVLTIWLGLCCHSVTPLRAAAPVPPAPRLRAEVQEVLQDEGPAARPLRIVLLADKKDHGEHEHDYPSWQMRWALLLGGTGASSARQVSLFGEPQGGQEVRLGAANVEVTCAQGWPDPEAFEKADVIVVFCYLRWDDPGRRRQIQGYLARGGGLVLIHSATWPRSGPSGDIAGLIGVGGFRLWRHGVVDLDVRQGAHPICRGLPSRIRFLDETYWPPTPPLDANAVTVLATASEKVDKSPESPVAPQPMFWVYRPGRGRVFGCVLGHYTWTFDDPYFRTFVLRGTAWAAGESPYRFDSLVLRGARITSE